MCYFQAFYLERPELRRVDVGDTSAQMQLRKDLGCKDFTWYLKNVATDMEIPDMRQLAKGQVGHKTIIIKLQ